MATDRADTFSRPRPVLEIGCTYPNFYRAFLTLIYQKRD